MFDWYLLTVQVSRRPSGDRLIRGMSYLDWSMIHTNDTPMIVCLLG